MRKCPYCAEEIQSDAIKCKHCGAWFAEANHATPISPTKGNIAENVVAKIDVIDTDDFKEKCLIFSEKRIVVARMSEISGLSAILGYPGIIVNVHLTHKRNEKTKALALDEILSKHKKNYAISNDELISITFFYKERRGIAKWALQENKKIFIKTTKNECIFRFKKADAKTFDNCILALQPIFGEKLIRTF